MKLLKNCRLIPQLTEGYQGEYADVLLDGRLIREIRPRTWPDLGDGGDTAEVVDGQKVEILDIGGMTLMPGLFDLHTHLCRDTFDFARTMTYDQGTVLFNTYEFAKEFLNWGYTTVRDVGDVYNSAAACAGAIRRGVVPGPRLITSGQIITPTETGNGSFGPMYMEADGPGEVRKACREQFKRGNDIVKYMVTGAFLNEKGDPGETIAMLDELKAAVEVAEMKHSYVAGHCHSDQGIRLAIEAGLRTIEHAVFIKEDTVERLLGSTKTFVIPTGAVSMQCMDEDNLEVSTDALEKNRAYAQAEQDAINMAYRAGLKMGFGSDIDLKAFRDRPGYEFIARKEFYSFDNLDILLQATRYSAEIAGLAHLTGTVKEGLCADLIVVDGDPVEDIYVMTRPVVHVFAEGKRFK